MMATILEVTVIFHNGHKSKFKLDGGQSGRELGYREADILRMVEAHGNIKFNQVHRVDSNVTEVIAAGSYRSVQIARL
jgi:hypothetical protein